MIHPKSAFLCTSPSLVWINASSLLSKAINFWLYGVKFLPTPSLGPNIVLRRQHWVIPLSRFELWTGEGARICWLPQKRSEFKEKHFCPSSAKARGKHHSLLGAVITGFGEAATTLQPVPGNPLALSRNGAIVGGAPSSLSTQRGCRYQHRTCGEPTRQHRLSVDTGSSYEKFPDLSM